MFCSDFCQIFKNIFFTEHIRVTASGIYSINSIAVLNQNISLLTKTSDIKLSSWMRLLQLWKIRCDFCITLHILIALLSCNRLFSNSNLICQSLTVAQDILVPWYFCPAGIHLFEVGNRNTKILSKICLELTIYQTILDEINEVDFKLDGINAFGKSGQIRSFFWSVFPRIWTDYGEILRTSPYSVRIRENTDQKNISDLHGIADP